jgi:hypothetical protein
LASGPSLSRTFVFHVDDFSWSTFLNVAPVPAPARLAGLGHATVAAVAVALLPASSSGSGYPQDWVYYATKAVNRYYLAHDAGWAGMTTAALQRYLPRLRYVRVVRASRSSYCLEATVAGESAMLAGPNSFVRMGTCAHPGAQANVHVYEQAVANVRMAIPAIEAWNADHNGYTGVTLAGLRSYDSGVRNVRIVRASKLTYCVEGRSGIWLAHKNGPAGDIRSGRCPR